MDFDLKLRTSPSEKEFRAKIGKEKYDAIIQSILERDNHTCRGCDFNGTQHQKAITVHLVKENLENPFESELVTLCNGCHVTQHIDVAVEKGWVKIVNSSFEQSKLIEMTRMTADIRSINENNTRFIKMPMELFIEKLKKGTLSKSTKAKIIFTLSFEWGI